MTRRKNGHGSIITLSDEKVLFRKPVGVLQNGNPKYETRTFDNQEKALKEANHWAVQKMREERLEAKQKLFSDYCINWLKIYKSRALRDSSYDVLETNMYQSILPIMRDIQLGNITSQDLQELIENKSNFLSLNTLKNIFSALKGVFYFAYLNSDIPHNPMDEVFLPKQNYQDTEENKIVVLTQEQQKFFLLLVLYEEKRITYCIVE